MAPEPFPQLSAFRDQVYRHLHRRSDARFEMIDALVALPPATAPAPLMLLPGFQRRWGRIYDALSAGQIDSAGVQGLLAQSPLDGGVAVYAVDASTWVQSGAETSPKRAYYHHHSRHSAGKPMVAGWSYQWMAQGSFRRDSWSAPMSVQRLEPNDNVQEVAARQIRALLTLRATHPDVPIFVCDAGYDPLQLAYLLNDQSLALLVRLRSNRCF